MHQRDIPDRRISNKDATQYSEKVIAGHGAAALRSHCGPTQPALLSTDAYRDFLKMRRNALAQRMSAFILEKSGI